MDFTDSDHMVSRIDSRCSPAAREAVPFKTAWFFGDP